MSLLTIKSKTDFLNFVLAIYYEEMSPDKDVYQTLIKTLSKNNRNAACAKVLEN